jgi:hypothetical protein
LKQELKPLIKRFNNFRHSHLYIATTKGGGFKVYNKLIYEIWNENHSEDSVRYDLTLFAYASMTSSDFHIRKDKFEFPFTFETVLNFGIKVISELQKFIESSDDLSNG